MDCLFFSRVLTGPWQVYWANTSNKTVSHKSQERDFSLNHLSCAEEITMYILTRFDACLFYFRPLLWLSVKFLSVTVHGQMIIFASESTIFKCKYCHQICE